MADPLTALGLAANIIQFITFASSLVSKTSEISNSAHGSTLENTELKAIATNLTDLNKQLEPPKAPGGNDKQSRKAAKSGERLRELCTECEKAAWELLSVIQRLEHGKGRSKWKSFRQALLSVWKESEIAALSRRLERYRSQIGTALLLSLRYHIQEREGAFDSLAEEIHRGTFVSKLVISRRSNLNWPSFWNRDSGNYGARKMFDCSHQRFLKLQTAQGKSVLLRKSLKSSAFRVWMSGSSISHKPIAGPLTGYSKKTHAPQPHNRNRQITWLVGA
jgi:hypothetical protein